MVYSRSIDSQRFIAIDCIIFGFEDNQLKVLLIKRKLDLLKGHWSLIGGWVDSNESVEVSANRILEEYTGLSDMFLEQIGVFSEPSRDPGGNVLSVAFYAFMNIEEENKKLTESFDAHWYAIGDIPKLIFDHEEMLSLAFSKLRMRATYELIGKNFLPHKFTLTQMRILYEQIFQKDFEPSNFRKKVLSLKQLVRLNEKDKSESKKGAFYFQFKEEEVDEDQEVEPIFRTFLKL